MELITSEYLAYLHSDASSKRGQDVPKHEAYLSISQSQGELLNFLVKYSNAKNIVEFGSSFGISTIYLASAAKETNGHVTTTELEENKIKTARKNFQKANIDQYITLLEGDALETLKTVKNNIDFLFLDGWKDLYLPVFKMLEEKLSNNAIIIADNANSPGIKPFVDEIIFNQSTKNYTYIFDGKQLLIHYRKIEA